MPGSGLLLLENFALYQCVTSGHQETPRQRKRFSSNRPAGKNALIFPQVVKRPPCFFPRMNTARLLCAWFTASFIHSSAQSDLQSRQSQPQFCCVLVHPTLNAQNWGKKGREELWAESRKQFWVLPGQTSGPESQRQRVVAGTSWVFRLEF